MFLKEPFNALSHCFGCIISLFALYFLYKKTRRQTKTIQIACLIYAINLVLLFLASTLYHAIDAGPNINGALQKIDHFCIFLLIAGTYTPLCLLGLAGTRYARDLLLAEWSAATFGSILKILWFRAPYTLHVTLYIAMGWMIFPFLGTLAEQSGRTTVLWLMLGGFFYTAGALTDALGFTKFPHEIFHVMVLLGATFHFKMILHLLSKKIPRISET